MKHDALIQIELVFATADKQRLMSVKVAAGTTARQAINHAELTGEFPDYDFSRCPLGIWGQPVAGSKFVIEGDRVEAYRALCRDPRVARRERVLQGRNMGRAKS